MTLENPGLWTLSSIYDAMDRLEKIFNDQNPLTISTSIVSLNSNVTHNFSTLVEKWFLSHLENDNVNFFIWKITKLCKDSTLLENVRYSAEFLLFHVRVP